MYVAPNFELVLFAVEGVMTISSGSHDDCYEFDDCCYEFDAVIG